MRGDFDEDEDDDYPYDDWCNTCMGAGFIVTCIDDTCRGADDGEAMTTNEQGRVILRVAREFRYFIREAVADHDPDALSLSRDIDELEDVGRWLSTTRSISLQDGISAAGSTEAPTYPVYRELRAGDVKAIE